jgi:hypothetical protein
VVAADDFEAIKPAPDIFLAAARMMGVAAAECVVVEDAPAGIQAAKAAGEHNWWCTFNVPLGSVLALWVYAVHLDLLGTGRCQLSATMIPPCIARSVVGEYVALFLSANWLRTSAEHVSACEQVVFTACSVHHYRIISG